MPLAEELKDQWKFNIGIVCNYYRNIILGLLEVWEIPARDIRTLVSSVAGAAEEDV